MPKFALELKFTCENLRELSPSYPCFRWLLKLKCTGCGEMTDKWQYIIEEEKFEIPSSRGQANFLCKCKLCGEQSSVDIIKNSTRSYKTDLTQMWQRMVVFDCRGMEPIDYNPDGGWTVVSSKSNATYEYISLDENEWLEYDEEGRVQLSIGSVEHRFVRV
uniref:CXXC motif containing zinc binding protein n=1 Tax=Trichuris muris TaxID=70415 RepID=A0A5S6QTN2_TRIMR